MRHPPERSTSLDGEPALDNLHRIVTPATITPLDNTSARIILSHPPGNPVDAIVTRVSPLGAELVISDGELDLHQGSSLVVEIDLNGATSKFSGLVVDLVSLPAQKVGVSIRLTEKEQPDSPDINRRDSTRWTCAEMFYPTGVASNPAKFNDFVYFRVHDISNNGFRILTSMRNKFVMPGVMLDCIISFPMVSQISTTVQVMNLGIVSEHDKDYLAIGVRINKMTQHQSNVIAQYLAQFGDVDSFSEMKVEGFSPTWLNKAFVYSFVNSATEYQAVLQLRHAAYVAEGKISSEACVADMSDTYDARSRILICRKGDTIAGTARLSFHENSDALEHEEFVRWPTNLPRRDELVEITRLCAHPEFQGSGLMFSLLRFCVITAVQARRTWVVSSATSDLVRLYESVGLKSVDITFNHPFLNHLKHHMLVGNIEDAMLGRTSGPIAWNLVWKDAFAFMVDHDFITIDIVSRVRLALYRSISPLIPMLRQLTSSRAKRKRN